MNDRFLRACRRKSVDRTPLWLMRQAGRYLPAYRRLRRRYDLLTICKTPSICTQATLLPVYELDVDAAIIFADIMLPLEGMGISFKIKENVGPIIANPVRGISDVEPLRIIKPSKDVPFVLDAIRCVTEKLDGMVPLIGFSGAPFTLASYIIEGRPSRDFIKTKTLMYNDPEAWHELMKKLTEVATVYLKAQIAAGAQAVQLFDSWVGCLSPEEYEENVLKYSQEIFDNLADTGVPRIHFGTGTATLLEMMMEAGGDVFSVDWRIPLDQAWSRLGKDVAIQGNLDPAVLFASGDIVESKTREVLRRAEGRYGHIFNLGHGVLPGTPVENVLRLIKVVREHSARPA